MPLPIHFFSRGLECRTAMRRLLGCACLIATLWGGAVQAADVTVQPAAGDAFVVRGSVGEQVRVQEDGSQISLGSQPSRKLLIDRAGRVLAGSAFAPVDSDRYVFRIDGTTGSFEDAGLRLENVNVNLGWSFYPSSSGALYIGTTGNLGFFDGATGAYSTFSDERGKTAIRPLEGVLGKVMGLQLSRYRYKQASADSIGVTAQNLQQQFPEFVSVNTTDEGNPIAPQQLFVDYAGLSVVALRALQEQQQQLQALQAELANLKSRMGAAR